MYIRSILQCFCIINDRTIQTMLIQAQDYYLRAYKLGIELERYVFLGRICANLGTLYTYQELCSQASHFQQKAVSYFEKNRDTVRLSLVFRDMARIHLNEHRLNLEEQFHNNNMPASYARANHSSHNNSLQSVSKNLKYVLSAFYLAPTYTTDTKELVVALIILPSVEYYPTISTPCPVLSQ